MNKIVNHFRENPRKGNFLTLFPYEDRFAIDVVNLRNVDRAKYYLNQHFDSTIQTQLDWAKEYFKRDNDIYWVIICNNTKKIIGTTSLYDITQTKCEKGRLVIDEQFATSKPYTLEAEIMIIKIAFEELNLKNIITTTRYNNEKMESINKRLGFVHYGSHEIRGVQYQKYVLEKANFNPYPFEKILNHWLKREGGETNDK